MIPLRLTLVNHLHTICGFMGARTYDGATNWCAAHGRIFGARCVYDQGDTICLPLLGFWPRQVAGTAFVGFPTLSGGSDTDPSGATDDAAPQTNDPETTDIGGFLDIDEDAERGLIDDLAVTDIQTTTIMKPSPILPVRNQLISITILRE
jgi:hypothetical protein